MSVDVSSLYTQTQGEQALRSISRQAEGLTGSNILKIATHVRALQAAGETVCNLTVGDFAPSEFGIPEVLKTQIQDCLARGETNYPPSDGLLELRQAICDFTEEHLGLRFPMEAVVVGSGARPPLYAALATLLDDGDGYVYGLPSWNNHYYTHLNRARPFAFQGQAPSGFHLTPEQLQEVLSEARVVHLNSPLNPCGTCIEPDQLRQLCLLIVEENQRRARQGQKGIFLLFDMVYWLLTYGDARHLHPIHLVPEVAPYVISIDALSKNFAGTGLRVGWGLVPPALHGKIKALIGHMGSWAPRPVQSAAAHFLTQTDALRSYLDGFRAGLEQRLGLISEHLTRWEEEGLPVEHIPPQGAIYLSARFAFRGRRCRGRLLESDEDIRRLLLEEAGMALVSFASFGLEEGSGWFRFSVGAVSMQELEEGMQRIAVLLREME